MPEDGQRGLFIFRTGRIEIMHLRVAHQCVQLTYLNRKESKMAKEIILYNLRDDVIDEATANCVRISRA